MKAAGQTRFDLEMLEVIIKKKNTGVLVFFTQRVFWWPGRETLLATAAK